MNNIIRNHRKLGKKHSKSVEWVSCLWRYKVSDFFVGQQHLFKFKAGLPNSKLFDGVLSRNKWVAKGRASCGQHLVLWRPLHVA